MFSLDEDDTPFERKEQSDRGVPCTKLTPSKDEAMRDEALEWGFDFSYMEMADYLQDLFDDFSRCGSGGDVASQALCHECCAEGQAYWWE